MKYLSTYFQLILGIIIAVILFACSSTQEKVVREEYFQPVAKIVYVKPDSVTVQEVVTRERIGPKSDENMKDVVIEMLRVQNRKLEDIIQQLNTFAKKEVVDNSAGIENLSELLATRDRVSNEMLLEMIREQNQRINEVIEQIKVLTQNQQSQRGLHSNLVARVNVDPIQPPSTPKNLKLSSQSKLQSPRLNGSLAYGKAVQLYQTKQYDKALNAFEKLIKRGINVKLADNCHFWMGVCYFNQKRGNQAISAFSEVLNYTGSDKAEGAYFMIGQCYEQMGARKFAKVAFEKLLKEYPRGTLTRVAERKLALLK
jgi:TolA-binding protein